MPSKLHNASQVIHLDHLRPAAKLLVRSVVRTRSGDDATDTDEDQWEVWVFALLDGSVSAWVGRLCWDKVRKDESELADSIAGGMLHVDLKGEKRVDAENEMTLHILDSTGRALQKIPLAPHNATEEGGGVSTDLLEACFALLARPAITKSDKGELRALHSQIAKKDEEIAHLQTKLASLKATVVRATASDNNKKKVMASPKKRNASTLQPNAKKRSAVEDSFAGSDSDSD